MITSNENTFMTSNISSSSNIFSSQLTKKFEKETSQIQCLITFLIDIKSQFTGLLELSKKNYKHINIFAFSLQSSLSSYSNIAHQYNDEPSNLYNILNSFLQFIGQISKELDSTLRTILPKLNNEIPEMCNSFDLTKNNIFLTSVEIMNDIILLQKELESLNLKYNNLKENLDSAQINQKKIESDPKTAYDENQREKAEKEVLSIVQEMEKLLPIINNKNSNIKKKQEIFNNHMKDTFELSIINIFKGLVRINQILFVISKKRYDTLNEFRNILFNKVLKNLRENSLTIDDFSERNFSCQKGLYYDPIHFNNNNLLEFNDENAINVVSLCDSYLHFITTEIKCYKIRRAIIKVLLKFVEQFVKDEQNFIEGLYKIENLQKKFNKMFEGYYSTTDIKKIYNNFSTIVSLSLNFHNTINKHISSNTIRKLTIYMEEMKKDFEEFESQWNKFKKKIINYKEEYIKIYNKNNKENKDILELEKKIKKYLTTSCYDFLSEKTKELRNAESKKLKEIINTINSIISWLKAFIETKLETYKNIIDNVTTNDIYDDVMKIFQFYVDKFNIMNYEVYMDKMKVKVISKIDFDQEEISKDAIEYIKNDINSNVLGNNPESFLSSESEKEIENLKKVAEDENNNENSFENQIDTNQIKNSNNFNLNGINSKNINIINNENAINSNINNEILTNNNKTKNKKNNLNITEDKKEDSKEFDEIFSENISNIDFINKDNFTQVNTLNPYQNFKPNEIKEILNKLKTDSIQEKIDNIVNIDEEDEKLIEKYSCKFKNDSLIHPEGNFYITSYKLAFISLSKDIKIYIPLKDIIGVGNETGQSTKKRHYLTVKTKKKTLKFYKFEDREKVINSINQLLKKFYEIIDNEEEENNKNIENENNVNSKLTRYQRQLYERNKEIQTMLQKIKFYERLKELDNKRRDILSEKFKDNNLLFRKPNEYTGKYYEKELISNCPVNLAWEIIINPDSKLESLGRNLGFFETYYLDRGDLDLVVVRPENWNKNIPKFYSDRDYSKYLFSELNENDLNEFLNDINNWTTDPTVFEVNFIHPLKKMVVGPDRITMRNIMNVHFISPLSFELDYQSFGSNFPFTDCFVNLSNYQFTGEYKFNQKKGIMEFKTFITTRAEIVFIKRCLFESMVKSEGYKTIEQDMKFSTFDKIKTTMEQYSIDEYEMFIKLSEENIRKNLYKYKGDNIDFEEEKEIEEDNNNNNENEKENVINEENKNIEKEKEDIKENEIKKLISAINNNPNKNIILIVIIILIFMIFQTLNNSSSFYQKLINLIMIFIIGFFMSKMILNQNKKE